jgi:sugar O-acyltransferase (sialic acid O-acetyltransferase NeuD family)
MKKEKVLIVGSSGHAKTIIDIFEKVEFEIIGLIDDCRDENEMTLGYSVLGKIKDIPKIINQDKGCNVFVAIGDNFSRQVVVNKITAMMPEIKFASAIHPSALIGKNAVFGKGVAILAGTIISADAKIGNFTIVSTKASAGHDMEMLEYSSLAPGVTTGGNVVIGECSAISIGAIVKEKLKIGNHSIIGAGSLLMKNCPDNVIMYGVPAKLIRKREKGEKYF